MRDPVEIVKKQIQGNTPDSKFKFVRFDVSFGLRSLDYKNLDVTGQRPIAVQQSIFTNDTDVQDVQTFTVDKTTTDSFTWSVTETLKLGSKFAAKIPFLGDSETTVELGFESTQGQTTSVARHWSYSAQVPVPPRSKIETTFSVLEGNISTPFTATFQARGYLYIEFDVAGPGQKPDWRYCSGDIADMIRSGYCVPDPKKYECDAKGTFTGVAATTYVVHTRPLPGGEQEEFARGYFLLAQPDQPTYASS